MKFEYTRDPSLPPLAWAMCHEAGKNFAIVQMGAKVQASESAFWEGLNLSCDDPAASAKHHFPLSTGGVAGQDDLLFHTPGHILDRLFMVKFHDKLYLSNSLPFVLRASKSSLAPRYLHYPFRFAAIRAHQQSLPIAGGQLTLFHNTNVRIGRDNRVVCERKPPAPEFRTYSEYKALLHGYLDEVSTSLSSPLNDSYSPVTTISKGYDSPATSVLARSIGANKALTITGSRNGISGDDSGEEIANVLGLETVSGLRTDYQSSGLEAEKLFYFSGIPEEIYLYPMRKHLKSTLLFSGAKGDTMWSRNPMEAVGTWQWSPGGASLQEFRLRTNFVLLPPAFFGWRHNRQLIEISRSPELAPWTLGKGYDRPIARRIVEEAGVPREMFGVSKRAVTICIGIDWDDYISEKDYYISPEFANLLDHHLREFGNHRVSSEIALANYMHGATCQLHRFFYRLKGDARPQIGKSKNANLAKYLNSHIMDIVAKHAYLRRKYSAPFSRLNFAPQVSNALLAEDYRDFD